MLRAANSATKGATNAAKAALPSPHPINVRRDRDRRARIIGRATNPMVHVAPGQSWRNSMLSEFNARICRVPGPQPKRSVTMRTGQATASTLIRPQIPTRRLAAAAAKTATARTAQIAIWPTMNCHMGGPPLWRGVASTSRGS